MPVGRQSAGANAAQNAQGKIMSQRIDDMEARRNSMVKLREISAGLQQAATATGKDGKPLVEERERQLLMDNAARLDQQGESMLPYNINAWGQKEFNETQQRGDQSMWSKGQLRNYQDEETAMELDMDAAANYQNEDYIAQNNAARDTMFQAIDAGKTELYDEQGNAVPLDQAFTDMYGEKGLDFKKQYEEYKKDPTAFEQSVGPFDKWKSQMADYIANDSSIQGQWNKKVKEINAPITKMQTTKMKQIDDAARIAFESNNLDEYKRLQGLKQEWEAYFLSQKDQNLPAKINAVRELGRERGDTQLRKATTGQTRSGALYGQGGG